MKEPKEEEITVGCVVHIVGPKVEEGKQADGLYFFDKYKPFIGKTGTVTAVTDYNKRQIKVDLGSEGEYRLSKKRVNNLGKQKTVFAEGDKVIIEFKPEYRDQYPNFIKEMEEYIGQVKTVRRVMQKGVIWLFDTDGYIRHGDWLRKVSEDPETKEETRVHNALYDLAQDFGRVLSIDKFSDKGAPGHMLVLWNDKKSYMATKNEYRKAEHTKTTILGIVRKYVEYSLDDKKEGIDFIKEISNMVLDKCGNL